MKKFLILTVGCADVQLVIDGQRYELDPKVCGKLHDEIVRRGYQLVDVPAAKSKERRTIFPEGELMLCTPKLDAVLQVVGGQSPRPTVIIFDTRRRFGNDPHLAGTVVERRLNEKGVDVACRHAFLTGEERLEGRKPEDAVVRREVVKGIAKVLVTQLAEVPAEEKVQVVAVTAGGIHAANEVIKELLRLYVGKELVEVWAIPDGALTNQNDLAVSENIHPATGIRARWHALSLIERGNILGAWGVVSPFDNESDRVWTNIVKWLKHFASSMPMPADCDIEVLQHPRMAVRAALRVELALRAEDIPRAVHGTVAFFEAALWDGLLERFERSEDPKGRRLFKIKTGKAPSGDKLLRKGDGSEGDDKCPFELKETIEEVNWYSINEGGGARAGRLAKRFLARDGLVKFNAALDTEKVLDCNIRSLRNDVAHNEPTEQLMALASEKMQAEQLWSADKTFLSQPLVQDVLRELGIESPATLLDTLLTEVRQRLRTIS